MIIRDGKAFDKNAIYRVVSSAFGRVAEAQLVGDLDRAGDVVTSLVAEKDAHILGHVLLSRMSAPFPALALGLVSVSVEQQRRGIESALIRAAVERAREDGWIGIFGAGRSEILRALRLQRRRRSGFLDTLRGQSLHGASVHTLTAGNPW
jgi:putative acetyltransferase